MGKTNVLWVINALGYGGAEKQLLYMRDILKNSEKLDITVLYYATVKDELPFDDDGLIFVDKSSIGPVRTVLAIRKVIKEKNIHIMHALGGGSANIYGRAAAALCGKVIPIGAMLGKKHFSTRPSRIINSFLNLFGNWWTVNNVDMIPIIKRDLKFLRGEKIVMLHNGFVPAEKVDFKYNEKTEYDTEKGDNFIFTVVGRTEPVKNYPMFITAAAAVAKDFPQARFWVVGKGTEYDRLVSLTEELGISDKVKFWGFRDDVDVALSRSDVFLQTSFTEGSPNTVAEAMRAKKPIISTRSTDMSEMVAEGENGYLIDVANLDGLIQAMKDMLTLSEEKRQAYGEKSYELFQTFFLDEKVCEEYYRLYDKALGGNNDA